MARKRYRGGSDAIASYALTPHIEVTGNSECVVDGLRSIVEYTRQRIKINMGGYYITFTGADLYINSFSRQGAIVLGTIISMEFDDYG